MYCFDTNIFVDWWGRFYPPDIFPCVQRAMESLLSKGLICSPERVKEEIRFVAPVGLKTWALSQGTLFVRHDAPLQTEANVVLSSFPGLIDQHAVHDEADRYIIALAKLRGFSVVTSETSAKQKRRPERSHYIPDVCRDLNIPCLSFLGLMREQGWKF